MSEDDIAKAANRTTGQSLPEALAEAGYGGRPRYVLEAGRHVGFIEAHIEQGDTLESSGKRVGVVTSIVGIWTYAITFEGQQNHAGTTRMAARKDAGVALTELCHAIAKRFLEIAGPRSVWTTGRIRLDPGAASIIPGQAEMIFQFRDADPERLRAMEQALEALVTQSDAAGPCTASLRPLSRSIPNVMAEPIQVALEQAAERHAPGSATRMPSGAGHDAQYLARHLPAGMLFVPSIGGISLTGRRTRRMPISSLAVRCSPTRERRCSAPLDASVPACWPQLAAAAPLDRGDWPTSLRLGCAITGHRPIYSGADTRMPHVSRSRLRRQHAA